MFHGEVKQVTWFLSHLIIKTRDLFLSTSGHRLELLSFVVVFVVIVFVVVVTEKKEKKHQHSKIGRKQERKRDERERKGKRVYM